MTGADIHKARVTLGKMWGLDRPLFMRELGELLRLKGRDPGASVRDWERDEQAPVTGPVSVAIEAMLRGYKPSHWDRVIRS